MTKIYIGIAALALLLAGVVFWVITRPKVGFAAYELCVYVEDAANSKIAQTKSKTDEVVTPIKPPVPANGAPNGKDKSARGAMAMKVSVVRQGATAVIPAFEALTFLDKTVLGTLPSSGVYKGRWDDYWRKQKTSLDAMWAETVGKAELEKAAEEDVDSSAGLVLVYDNAAAANMVATYWGKDREVVSSVEKLREKVLSYVLGETAGGKGKSSRPTVRVVLRQSGHDDPKRFDVLVPYMEKAGERITAKLAETLSSLVAPAVVAKVPDIGVRRDDNPNQRLAYTGEGFWKSEASVNLIGRPPADNANSDAGIEELLNRMDKTCTVLGFTLPPFSDLQMEQVQDQAMNKFGKHEVLFSHDAAALQAKVEAAVKKGVSIALIIRPAPNRSLDRVIVRKPVILREEASLISVPVASASSAPVMAQWFEVLYVWEKKDGKGVNGESVAMLKVADQEYTGKAGGSRRVGWIAAADVVPWNGPLVMRFTHPPGARDDTTSRKRVLFWNDLDACQRMIDMPDDGRTAAADDVYQAIEKNSSVLPAGVAAVEPEAGVDWEKKPYVLPVLQFKRTKTSGDREGLLLKTLSLTRKSVEVKSPANPTAPSGATLPIDIVFVMDLSCSMGKWVAPTRAAIESLRSGLLTRFPEVASRVRFGLWGYRDGYWDTVDDKGKPLREGRERMIPNIGFITRNFTPKLQDAATFARTLGNGQVVQTETDSVDLAEDMLAGVHDAITRTEWSKDSARFVILLGDAPGRENGSADEIWLKMYPSRRAQLGKTVPTGTRSAMDIDSLRGLASEWKIYLASLYLVDPKHVSWYNGVGKDQFTRLALNPGTPASLHHSVSANNDNEYQMWINALVNQLGTQISAISKPRGTFAPEPAAAVDKSAGAEIARGLFEAMLKDFRRTGCDQIFEGWVWDRDLVNPAKCPLEPCVLVKSYELKSLCETLEDHIFELKKGNTEDAVFLSGVQSLAVWLMIKFQSTFSAVDLGHARASTAYLRGLLPYESLALSISAADWTAKSGSDRARFLSTLESKLSLYRKFLEDSDRWREMREGEPSDDHVMLLPLMHLP